MHNTTLSSLQQYCTVLYSADAGAGRGGGVVQSSCIKPALHLHKARIFAPKQKIPGGAQRPRRRRHRATIPAPASLPACQPAIGIGPLGLDPGIRIRACNWAIGIGIGKVKVEVDCEVEVEVELAE